MADRSAAGTYRAGFCGGGVQLFASTPAEPGEADVSCSERVPPAGAVWPSNNAPPGVARLWYLGTYGDTAASAWYCCGTADDEALGAR